MARAALGSRSTGRSVAGKGPAAGLGQDAGLVLPLPPLLCPLGRDRQGSPGPGCGTEAAERAERDQSSSHLSLGPVFLSLIVNRFD